MFKINFHRDKETRQQIHKRIIGLCKPVDTGIMQPPMDLTVALNELARFLLGDKYYIENPVNNEQAATQIVYDIECKYQNCAERLKNND